jgi:hypothetical protein
VTSITVERELTQSPSVVWEELRHIERHVNWMMDATTIDFDSAQREGVGTSFRCTTKVGPITLLDAMTITTWVEKTVMGVEHRGVIGGRGIFTLSPRGTGTLLAWRENLVDGRATRRTRRVTDSAFDLGEEPRRLRVDTSLIR